jgi:hypothetical protein
LYLLDCVGNDDGFEVSIADVGDNDCDDGCVDGCLDGCDDGFED